MSENQVSRAMQIVEALATEGEACDKSLDDSRKLRWYRDQAKAALELPQSPDAKIVLAVAEARCDTAMGSWSCVERAHLPEAMADIFDIRESVQEALALLEEPQGLLSTLKIDPSTVEG